MSGLVSVTDKFGRPAPWQDRAARESTREREREIVRHAVQLLKRRPSTAARPAARTATGSRTSSTANRRSSSAPTHVVLTAQAAARIREIIGNDAGFDREWGGGLFGYRDGSAAVVAWAIPVEPGAHATPRELSIRSDRLLAFEQPGDLWIGDFHSHPKVTAVPSTADRSAWANAVRDRPGFYTGLIATPKPSWGEFGFVRPNLSAWITDRNGNCKAVRIEEERWL